MPPEARRGESLRVQQGRARPWGGVGVGAAVAAWVALGACLCVGTWARARKEAPRPLQDARDARRVWEWREQARDMWHHAWDAYLTNAFPLDELRPLECTGRRWDARVFPLAKAGFFPFWNSVRPQLSELIL